MKAKSFDRKFEKGTSVIDDLDLSKARRPLQELEQVSIDLPVWMIAGLNDEAARTDSTWQSLARLWIAQQLTGLGTGAMSNYKKAVKRADVSVGEAVRIMRKLQGMSQNDLAKLSRIPRSTISSIENNRINLSIERARTLARALRCHPAVLVFPDWDEHGELPE